jgi:cysteine-rich repeat protein
LELCDDGNLTAGDGCDPLCRPEPIYSCENGVCEPVCGDGVTLYPFEPCDDGNLISGDGCSSACTREEGYVCTDYTNPTPPEHPSRHCLQRLPFKAALAHTPADTLTSKTAAAAVLNHGHGLERPQRRR